VIVEMLANVNFGNDLTILAKGGRVVIIGSRGPVEINPRNAMQRDADVRGMILPNTPRKKWQAFTRRLWLVWKTDIASGDRQRIWFSRSSRGTSSGDETRAFGKIVFVADKN
jgi:NADPH2:quinone reductase